MMMCDECRGFKQSFVYKILHYKTVTADKLEVLNELQKIQVEYPELQNLDELVHCINFVNDIKALVLFVWWLMFDM